MNINWNKISRDEMDLINKIADRGIAMTKKLGGSDLNKMDVAMDLSAAHITCPLNLNEFLNAKDGDFGHDFYGIRRYINRHTGQLGCFLPRCAAAQREKA